MRMVHVFYTAFDSPLPAGTFKSYIERLPLSLKQINSKYVRWQDQTANLLGKLLLAKALSKLQLNYTLNDVRLSDFKKPYISGAFDFSISHSGRYVVCIVALGQKVGIDVEQIRTIDVNDFANVLTLHEMKSILQSANPPSEFCRLWTVKESVIKGDGRGLQLPLKEIVVSDGVAELFDKRWFLQERMLDPSYCLTIATEHPAFQIVERWIPNSAL